MLVRVIVLGILMLMIDWYSFQAVQIATGGINSVLHVVIDILFWCVPAVALLFLTAVITGWSQRWRPGTVTIIRSVVMILYFSKLLVALAVLVDDLRRLALFAMTLAAGASGGVSRSEELMVTGLALGGGILVSLLYGMVRNPYRYKVHNVDLTHEGLHSDLDGLKIVQISDIHSGSLYDKQKVARSVDMINDLNPDIVCFTGDLVNTRANEIDPYLAVFSAVGSKLGVYSVLGNHDYGDYYQWNSVEEKQANFVALQERHDKMGWQLLMNEHKIVKYNDARIGICGVENYSAHPRFPKYGDLEEAMDGIEDVDYCILLSHDPTHWDDEVTVSYPEIDLTLSGHTHGFQFGIEVGNRFKWSPVQYVYRKWAGLYNKGRQYLYINRGLGFLGYPGRVGILPEITLLTLRKAS